MVSAVVGAVAAVATAVSSMGNAFSSVAEAVIGAAAAISNACEDFAEDAEELIEEEFKLLVGAFIAEFGSFKLGSESDDYDNSNTGIIAAILSTSNWFGYDHYLVQQYILTNRPNEFKDSINLQGEIFIPNGGRYGVDGRADVVDTGTGEIWEIKSIITRNYEESIGSDASQEQLQRYIDNYPTGNAYNGKFITQFSFPKDDKTDIVVASDIDKPGMLYYWERNRKHEQDQEQEQGETSTANEKESSSSQISEDSYDYPTDHSKDFWERMKVATGLSGAALVTYIIISEGSRLFPPRNLVPVP
ncbi:hypothetical protein [Clostridium saccharobutylicum]|uniref:Uncharacterized protein n=1 Tax=Clostridium saccharobutylicum DSM 13864 TaxID=1345695 RepID=U5MXG0_CLOSA|nr:hypothetical protein [Clostridium saccharobutylicum]AGX44142.1 hypothetical protein CLSA_c31760 [Clostridium saccharobutylicum DSM 13864]AQR91430.1 hypothetical protein CLOSC_31550 [Clostridium saccharobutylicum]AQS01334.1 hypothetical protein CSACC_31620 [Clostridium saccharobutylicum]AQS10944.1 hypothetical protein CLOBY_30930 [Clostridium saccharobutylicum]AQS15317.1 hypothetical protein CLOSACC_31620 [Clostridium saccharobutylicum]